MGGLIVGGVGCFSDVLLLLLLVSSYTSVPGRAMALSGAMKGSLRVLRSSRCAAVGVCCSGVRSGVGSFVRGVCSPCVVRRILGSRLSGCGGKRSSLCKVVRGTKGLKNGRRARRTLGVVLRFARTTGRRVSTGGGRLLAPMLGRRDRVLTTVSHSCQGAVCTGTALATFLRSAQGVGRDRDRTLSVTNLKNLSGAIAGGLIRLSKFVSSTVGRNGTVSMGDSGTRRRVRRVSGGVGKLAGGVEG